MHLSTSTSHPHLFVKSWILQLESGPGTFSLPSNDYPVPCQVSSAPERLFLSYRNSALQDAKPVRGALMRFTGWPRVYRPNCSGLTQSMGRIDPKSGRLRSKRNLSRWGSDCGQSARVRSEEASGLVLEVYGSEERSCHGKWSYICWDTSEERLTAKPDRVSCAFMISGTEIMSRFPPRGDNYDGGRCRRAEVTSCDLIFH